MTYQFEYDEFTSWTLLEYLKRAFGAQVNGRAFTLNTISQWILNKKVPDAYGGHKIYQVCRHKPLHNVCTFRVEDLNRKELEEAFGKLDEFAETLNKRRAQEPKKKGRRPNGARTALYYQTLGSKVRKQTVLPDNYAELGIKNNQTK